MDAESFHTKRDSVSGGVLVSGTRRSKVGGLFLIDQESRNPVDDVLILNTCTDSDSPIVASVATTVRFLNSQPVCHSPGILRQ